MESHFEKPSCKILAAAYSDIGQRKNNEDAWLVDEKIGLFLVADGMGGHEKGEIASSFTVASLNKIISSLKKTKGHDTFDHDEPYLVRASRDDLIKYAVFITNKKIYDDNEMAIANATKGYEWSEIAVEIAKKKRMGTTLVSMLLHDKQAYITHIGDSRAYRIAQGSIERLTEDHSWVEEQVRLGKLTPEEASVHKKRNVITRSVGFKKDVDADIDVLQIKPPERFLLCSDGLSNIVDEGSLLRLGQMKDVRVACYEMVKLAKDRGGRDNITALMVDVLDWEDSVDSPIKHQTLREYTDI